MIRYDEQLKKATQYLGFIYYDELAGSFNEVIENLQSRYEVYSSYITKEHSIREEYSDGTKEKKVKFDRIYIDCVDFDTRLAVMGERRLTNEESEAIEFKKRIQNKRLEEQEKEQLKKLLEKYPNG